MQTKKQQQLAERKRQSTRQLIGIEGITEFSLKTGSNTELVFFSIKPSNISVLSEEALGAKIYALMSVLKGVTEMEIVCANSRESFESNKAFIKKRIAAEENPAVRELLERDAVNLDHIQAQTATAREFMFLVRTRNMKDKELFAHLNRIEKMVLENGFTVARLDNDGIKTLLAVYFEQNTTNEKFENIDGERWLKNE
ncbi:MAG TPA: hypothetical protein DDX72_10310 [Ruminococcaceae bacterium]|nr:hypothetical protein [Oscillospiraceae bacterium]